VCGVNGLLRLKPDGPPLDREELRRTRDYMASRGPDAVGDWLALDGRAALGHRRLAIIDLSPTAHQPMSWAGRFWIVFNGEIYNYKELREELTPEHTFQTHSDTEVILALFGRDGAKGLARLRGMFALAIWDERDKRLLLARDPNGIKPLYYSSDGQHFRFASQVKALIAGGRVAPGRDPIGLCGFLLWGSVPEPWTTHEAIKAVPAGHVLWIGPAGIGEPEPLARVSADDRGETDLGKAIETSVAAHLVSDVPVAVFLSAGLDSTLVAAIACRHLPAPPVTITLRFREFEGRPEDEGPLAAEVARVLGTRHIERFVTREEFAAGRAQALGAMDQPSIDGLNTYWVCRAAREVGVKVALSGLGGDELLGGYPSFHDVPSWQRWSRVAKLVPGLSACWPRLSRIVSPHKPKLRGLLRYGPTLPGSYLLRRGLFLPEELPGILGPEITARGLAGYDPIQAAADLLGVEACSGWEAVQALETRLYLRNQLLRDSDWASMAHSVELRVPFVDAWLQQAAAASGFAMARSLGKRGLVRRLAPGLPAELFDRRKTGFTLPSELYLGERSSTVAATSRSLALDALRVFAPAARVP
jgi:asparagine synthase (glutamine-hydrolysing)